MFVHALPREFLLLDMPLQHLPVHHGARENVYLMIVLGVCMPQLRRLPVDGTNQATDHGPRRLLHLSQTKVCNFGSPARGDEDVGGLAIAMDDRWLAKMQILQTACNVKHDIELSRYQQQRPQ